MKLIHKIVLISGFIALGFLSSACSQPSNPNIQRVDAQTFVQAIQDSTIVVVDVRTEQEHIAGSIPETDFWMDVMGGDFEAKVEQLLPKGGTIAIYCRSGNRSQKAASILAQKGFKVIELKDGYKGWKKFNDAK